MKNLSLQFLQAQDVVTILHEIPEVEDTPEFTNIIDLPTLESLIQKLPQGYQTVFRLSVLENKTQNRFEKYRDRRWMKTGVCADCSFWRYCEGNGMHLRDSSGNLLHCHLKKPSHV